MSDILWVGYIEKELRFALVAVDEALKVVEAMKLKNVIHIPRSGTRLHREFARCVWISEMWLRSLCEA
jgi:hypothetical protein